MENVPKNDEHVNKETNESKNTKSKKTKQLTERESIRLYQSVIHTMAMLKSINEKLHGHDKYLEILYIDFIKMETYCKRKKDIVFDFEFKDFNFISEMKMLKQIMEEIKFSDNLLNRSLEILGHDDSSRGLYHSE